MPYRSNDKGPGQRGKQVRELERSISAYNGRGELPIPRPEEHREHTSLRTIESDRAWANTPSVKLDRPLTAEQMANKYNDNANGHGEHPVFARCDWRVAVEEQETLDGYWAWVVCEIDSELDGT